MKPDKKHKQYDDMEVTWQKCRDTSVGERAVKKAGPKYLPLLGGQTNASDKGYQAYIGRARFFNAVSRTIDAMSGHIFRKQPVIELPDAIDDYRNDINMAGLSLEGFARQAIEEVIEVGRAGVLVDYPPQMQSEKGVALTIEQSRQQGLRPYLTLYKTEAILNWRTGRVNNTTKLIQLFLAESYEDADGCEQIQIRELVLTDRYRQIVYRQGQDSKWFEYTKIEPTMRGSAMQEIPFFFLAPKEGGPDVQKPRVEELANICIGYYQNSADYENALHVSGMPTPWINGIDEPDKFPNLHLGSNTFLKLPKDAVADFLQCGSDGVAALKEAIAEKRGEMAAMGAKFLEPEKRQAESGEAHGIKRGGENSILATLAGSVEMSIKKALEFMAVWVGADPQKVKFELNKDYLPNPMDAQMLREWTNSYLSGAISFETYFEGLIAGEVVSEKLTADEERERKEFDTPALGVEGGDNGDA